MKAVNLFREGRLVWILPLVLCVALGLWYARNKTSWVARPTNPVPVEEAGG